MLTTPATGVSEFVNNASPRPPAPHCSCPKWRRARVSINGLQLGGEFVANARRRFVLGVALLSESVLPARPGFCSLALSVPQSYSLPYRARLMGIDRLKMRGTRSPAASQQVRAWLLEQMLRGSGPLCLVLRDCNGSMIFCDLRGCRRYFLGRAEV